MSYCGDIYCSVPRWVFFRRYRTAADGHPGGLLEGTQLLTSQAATHHPVSLTSTLLDQLWSSIIILLLSCCPASWVSDSTQLAATARGSIPCYCSANATSISRCKGSHGFFIDNLMFQKSSSSRALDGEVWSSVVEKILSMQKVSSSFKDAQVEGDVKDRYLMEWTPGKPLASLSRTYGP